MKKKIKTANTLVIKKEISNFPAEGIQGIAERFHGHNGHVNPEDCKWCIQDKEEELKKLNVGPQGHQSYGIDAAAELSRLFSEEILKKNPIDWKGFIKGDYNDSSMDSHIGDNTSSLGESINEPYMYKDTSEFKESVKPITHIKGTWKVPLNEQEISMEMKFEYTPKDDSNVREDYKELISDMWKAKHRNEIIFQEIDTKYDSLMKEKNKKKHH